MKVDARKIMYWAFFIVILTALAYFVLSYYLKKQLKSEPFDVSEHFSKHIESKIGMTCSNFYELVGEFIDQELSIVIETGAKGGGWLALISDEKLEKIDLYEQNAFDCMLVEVPKENNKFKPIQEMLSPLEAFSLASSERNRTSANVKPEAFDLIREKYYQIEAEHAR